METVNLLNVVGTSRELYTAFILSSSLTLDMMKNMKTLLVIQSHQLWVQLNHKVKVLSKMFLTHEASR